MEDSAPVPGPQDPGRFGGRTRALAGLAGILLAIALSALLVPREHPRAPDRPQPVRSDVSWRWPNGLLYDVDFASERDGFAIGGHCLRYWDPDCGATLLSTSDGANWTARPIPADAAGQRLRLQGEVLALGRCKAAIAARAPSRLYTADCGRSWRAVGLGPRGTVSAIPAGAVLESSCFRQPSYPGGCLAARLLVTRPAGTRAWLSASPELDRPRVDDVRASDGSWWVSGADPATGRLAVAVSRDAGRSWSTRVLPDIAGTLSRSGTPPPRMSVAVHGNRVYVTAVRLHRHIEYRLIAIFASADGGETWRQTWGLAEDAQPRTVSGSVIPHGGGRLTVIDRRAHSYRSDDDGRTFRPGIATPKMAWARWTRGGYVAVSADEPARWYRSADGSTWTEIAFPERA